MKFNVEIEIDWIDENDGSIDEIVKNGVISSLTKQLKDTFSKQVEQKLNEAISPIIKEMPSKIDDLVAATYDEMINREVNITDEYGDIVKNINIKKLVKEKWEKFLTEKVDRDGRASNYGNSTRLQYMIDDQIQKRAKDFTDKTVKEVNELIKKTVSDGLTQKIGGKLMDVLKVNELLELPNRKDN